MKRERSTGSKLSPKQVKFDSPNIVAFTGFKEEERSDLMKIVDTLGGRLFETSVSFHFGKPIKFTHVVSKGA
jgi:hypothetical protein